MSFGKQAAVKGGGGGEGNSPAAHSIPSPCVEETRRNTVSVETTVVIVS